MANAVDDCQRPATTTAAKTPIKLIARCVAREIRRLVVRRPVMPCCGDLMGSSFLCGVEEPRREDSSRTPVTATYSGAAYTHLGAESDPERSTRAERPLCKRHHAGLV
jgi:hypothetical protein